MMDTLPAAKRIESDQMSGCYLAEISLSGTVDTDDMMPWVWRHARKLDVDIKVIDQSQTRLRLHASGAEELVQALALGCSLGPIGAAIDNVEVTPRDAHPTALV